MRNVLVTGAEGFAGTHLIEFLRGRGVDVVAGVRNRGRKLALERRVGKALVCDVSDAINVARVVAGVKPDGIIHLAGCSRPFSASCEPLEAYQSIVKACAAHGVVAGVHAKADLAAKHRSNGFKMVTISTDLSLLQRGAARDLALARETS